MIDWLRAVAWSLALLLLIGVLTLLAWAYWAGDTLRRYRRERGGYPGPDVELSARDRERILRHWEDRNRHVQ